MKEGIRKKILSLRFQLSQEELIYNSQTIQDVFFLLPEFTCSENILFYVSIKNEVLTEKMICNAVSMGKSVFLPAIAKKKEELEIYEMISLKHIVKGPYNTMEPDKLANRKADSGEIDLLVIPGIAFDTAGNRIGYGKGYYDKFLKGLSNSAFRIALAFDFQIVQEIQTSGHDIKVDKIITESRVIECKQPK